MTFLFAGISVVVFIFATALGLLGDYHAAAVGCGVSLLFIGLAIAVDAEKGGRE